MKTWIIAAGFVAAASPMATAEPWRKDHHPYAERHHSVCQEKAHRLHAFERRASADGHLSRGERAIMRDLERDLDATCGRFRWRG